MALFTAKWQHSKPSVRIKSITDLNTTSPELIQLAQSDPDQAVRIAAIVRLQHIPTLAELATVAASPFINTAKSTLSKLIGQENGDDQALSAILHLIPQDQALYLTVISNPNRALALRKKALAYISNQNTFLNIAQTNPTKEIQTLAANQIVDINLLKQLLATADNNKSLRQQLKSTISEHESNEKNASQWIQLCGAIEGLKSADKWQQEKLTYQLLQQEGKALPNPADTLQTRFNQACQQYESLLSGYEANAQELEPQRQTQQAILARITQLISQLKQTPESLTPTGLKQSIKAIKSEWQSIGSLPKIEQERNQADYQDAISSLDHRARELSPELEKLHQLVTLKQQANKLNASKKTIRPQQISTLEKQWQQAEHPERIGDLAGLKQDFNQTLAQLNKRAKQQHINAGEQLTQINSLLDQLDEQLKTDQSNKAVNTFHQLSKLFEQAESIPPAKLQAPQQHFNKASAQVRQLQGWKHWGTDQAREQLIGRAKVLATDDSIEPTKLAKEIAQLRDAWKNMGRANSKSYEKLWTEFDSFCTLAYTRCQAFFQQQSDKRGNNLTKREAICQQLENLATETDWTTADWPQVTSVIKTARQDWKKMGAVDRKQWDPINKRFNDAMDALEIPLSQERAENIEQRQRLIDQMIQLVDKKDISMAIDKARFLQKQWQVTVAASRSEEQALWKTFQAAASAVFDKQRNERQAERDIVSADLSAQKALCITLEKMRKLDDAGLLKASADIEDLYTEFMALEPKPIESKQRSRRKPPISALARRFNQARDKVDAELIKRQANAKNNDFQLLQQKADLCEQLEQYLLKEKGKAPDTSEWETLDPLKDKKLESAITDRYQRALDKIVPTDTELNENLATKQAICLQLEILLDKNTPAAFKPQRMAEQLAYLSGEKQLATSALSLTQEFLSVGTVSSKEKTTLHTRFNALLPAIS